MLEAEGQCVFARGSRLEIAHCFDDVLAACCSTHILNISLQVPSRAQMELNDCEEIVTITSPLE
jgi:hypothetical protein